MATQQPYFNNGIFSPVASEQNLGQIFGERSAAVNDLENQTRASFLAERQMPSQLSGFEKTHQTNLAGLSTLPQETKIKQEDLKMQEKFQTIQQILSARAQDNLPPEVRQAVIEGGVSKILDLNMGIDPKQPLGSIDRQAAKKRAYQYFIQMANENPQGFEAELRKSLSALSMTRKGTEQYDLETQKGELDIVKSLMSADPQPGGSGAANEIKYLEHYRKGLSDVRMAMNQELDKDQKANSLGIIVDQAGQLQKTRKLDENEERVYQSLKNRLDAKYGAERQQAYLMLQQARRAAGQPYDSTAFQSNPQPTPAPQPSQTQQVTPKTREIVTRGGNKVVIERQ